MNLIHGLKTNLKHDFRNRNIFKRHNKSHSKKDTCGSAGIPDNIPKTRKRDAALLKCKAACNSKPFRDVRKLLFTPVHMSKEAKPIASNPCHRESWRSRCKSHDDGYFSTETPSVDTPPNIPTQWAHSPVASLSTTPSTSSSACYSPDQGPVTSTLVSVSSPPDSIAAIPDDLPVTAASLSLGQLHPTSTFTDSMECPPLEQSTDCKVQPAQTLDTIVEDPYWGKLREIDDNAITRLILRLLSNDTTQDYEVLDQKQGSYHVVYIIESSQGQKVCLKIPASGQPGRWCSDDIELLRSEALTMRLIKRKTQVPIPTVFAFDTTMDNEIRAPFILMSFIAGRPAHELCAEWRLCPGSLVEKQKVLIQSVAKAMADLSRLSFDKIGMLTYPEEGGEPIVGPYNSYRTSEEEDGAFKREWTSYGPFRTSQQYFASRLDATGDLDWLGGSTYADLEGVLKMAEVCVTCIPPSCHTVGSPEVFGLAHSNLDLQNILCKDDGTVVGTIDWEKIHTAPIYLGSGAVPLWLREDWTIDYDWPYGKPLLSPRDLEIGRGYYPTALRTHLDKPHNWLVPEKSVI
ncbi:hypothetical protein EJ08DRAFT_699270 [Tothia fuscella]|uniref:Aminoglycoside phosphotransferase domain-containing protein n=1 Tax=Tothia fuscella TaxID=1048955 RepID=A0A9P4NME0_9PEZI|nr:hypothetical protein EJ08DRAFT_699270 [Tothia fuscella]